MSSLEAHSVADDEESDWLERVAVEEPFEGDEPSKVRFFLLRSLRLRSRCRRFWNHT
jgi:hypothetical protein